MIWWKTHENQIWFGWWFTYNKTIEIHIARLVVRVTFYEDSKYCSEAFLDECLYGLWII